MFTDRTEAGRLLAAQLQRFKGQDGVILALPRGGVPVAAEIASALNMPLDLLLVRKVGVPSQPELAVGAVTDGQGMQLVINEDVAAITGMNRPEIEALARRQVDEIERRRALWCGARKAEPVKGRLVIVADDGMATGATARAALKLLGAQGAARIVLAVPVASREAAAAAKSESDEVVCLAVPEYFHAVGAYYHDFPQLEDDEVSEILARSDRARQAHS